MTPAEIAAQLRPYLADTPEPAAGWPHLYAQLATYLELLLKWNARTNLTAIREPNEIVRRHFGESLFAALHVGPCSTLLDFGSGAGFPGIPIQLLRPDIQVTLAESQGKKAAFLREVVRTLALRTEVLPARVESLPPDRTFEVTTLRAVDHMQAALQEAASRTTKRLLILTTTASPASELLFQTFQLAKCLPLPASASGIITILERPHPPPSYNVPRGTLKI